MMNNRKLTRRTIYRWRGERHLSRHERIHWKLGHWKLLSIFRPVVHSILLALLSLHLSKERVRKHLHSTWAHGHLRHIRHHFGSHTRRWHHHHTMMSHMLFSNNSCLLPFSIKEKLPHLRCTLSEGLTGLFAGGIIANLVPETRLFVFLEKSPTVFTNGTDDRAGDGRLIILACFQIGSTVKIDQVSESSVSRVNVGASTPVK